MPPRRATRDRAYGRLVHAVDPGQLNLDDETTPIHATDFSDIVFREFCCGCLRSTRECVGFRMFPLSQTSCLPPLRDLIGLVVDGRSNEQVATTREQATVDLVDAFIVVSHAESAVTGVEHALFVGERFSSRDFPGDSMRARVATLSNATEPTIPVIILRADPDPAVAGAVGQTSQSFGKRDARAEHLGDFAGTATVVDLRLAELTDHAAKRDTARGAGELTPPVGDLASTTTKLTASMNLARGLALGGATVFADDECVSILGHRNRPPVSRPRLFQQRGGI